MERTAVNPPSFFERYFFSKSRYPNAGLIRFVLCGFFLFQSYRNYRFLGTFTGISPEADALHKPSIFIDLLNLPFPLPKEYLFIFAVVFYAIGIFAMLGIFTRVSVFLFSIFLIYLTDIQAARGFFNHEFSLATQVLLLLALIPGSKSSSVDRWLQHYRKTKKMAGAGLWNTLVGPPENVWGIKLILILFACTYFTSGLSKVRYGGMDWLDGRTLTHYLDGSASPYTPGKKPMFIGPPNTTAAEQWKDGFGVYSYSYGNRQPSHFWRSTGTYLASHPKLISFIATSVVIFEMLGIVLVFGGWIRVFYLLGAIIMHKSIGSLMNLPFLDYQVLCFLLIDWHWVYQHLNRHLKNWLKPLINRFRILVRAS